MSPSCGSLSDSSETSPSIGSPGSEDSSPASPVSPAIGSLFLFSPPSEFESFPWLSPCDLLLSSESLDSPSFPLPGSSFGSDSPSSDPPLIFPVPPSSMPSSSPISESSPTPFPCCAPSSDCSPLLPVSPFSDPGLS